MYGAWGASGLWFGRMRVLLGRDFSLQVNSGCLLLHWRRVAPQRPLADSETDVFDVD